MVIGRPHASPRAAQLTARHSDTPLICVQVLTVVLISFFLIIDLAFFLANSTQILHGGWFPLAVGIAIFVLLTTWNEDQALLKAGLERDAIPAEDFLRNVLVSDRTVRVPRTAVFLTNVTGGVPLSLLHNLKHNHVLHQRVVLLSVVIAKVPYVPPERGVDGYEIESNCFRVTLHYGYMQETNIPRTLANARYAQLGFFYEPLQISYFLSRKTVVPSSNPGMSLWRETLFAWMVRNSATPMDFFCLPVNRVVELGGQVEI